MLQEVESRRGNKLTIPASPLRLSRTPGAIQGPPPAIGADTRDVLAELLGLSEAEVDAEFAKGTAKTGQGLPKEMTG
jgi:crotonobetainyl-CoA:carnitine CoA-transferase CaiB-like acyl-CoA transferase